MERSTLIKFFSAWALYITLHFSYRMFASPATYFLGCPAETLFTHGKMSFFSYLIVSIGFIIYAAAKKKGLHIWAAGLANCIYPYLSFFLWFIIPGVFGEWKLPAQEIIYSNVILAVCLLITVALETEFRMISWSRTGKAAVAVLFAASFFLYTAMTLRTPDIEFFGAHSHGNEVVTPACPGSDAHGH
ncbi:MAG: hypothetical protein AABZ39_12390 [Spirochaetota bacterium]